jgi:hypothetical protein
MMTFGAHSIPDLSPQKVEFRVPILVTLLNMFGT